MSEKELPNNEQSSSESKKEKVISLSGMYENYFLDYASYVILERAVPAIEDGLKPVQRRILHSLFELDDGRYNKVANVVGNTMKYHPHGDASIADAMVQIGQKELLIDTQGNWGNILTGDRAAASRYIEARLTKFAKDVVFNDKTTNWQLSYDGRNKEPITLPVKFPLLLSQGVEGIAVGLACKIMPHNFIELIDGCVDVLKGKRTNILPDFPTGGMADFSRYNSGLRGGKILVRGKVSVLDAKTLVITEVPFGTTTGSLIDSIVSANDKGKIKIRKVEDNTAAEVEILVHLLPGTSPDQMIDALYAFTDCEVSISPNACVIVDKKPRFLAVDEILRISAENTRDLLLKEQEIRKGELLESILFTSLEKIFIENKIYNLIEEAETWEQIIAIIDKGLKPFKKQFYRDITVQDIERLTEIRIKRISKFDGFKADETLIKLQEELKKTQENIENITEFTIDYYKDLKKKYGAGRERKTEIRSFESIEATQVVARTEKLYVDYDNGFVGYGLKNAVYVSDCSDIDDIIVFRNDGVMTVVKAGEKVYVGKGILHAAIWKKDDNRTIYHMVYRDGTHGPAMMKRFAVTSITRDKEYDLTKGAKGSQVLYFSVNPNGESEILTVYLKPRPKLKKQIFDVNFGELAIKGRNSQGNILSKNPIRKIVSKSIGESTLSAQQFWFDPIVRRLNFDERGNLLGGFIGRDRILSFTQSGTYRLSPPDISLHFEDDLLHVEKFKPNRPISAIYFDGDKKEYYVKRFVPETEDKPTLVISEHNKSQLLLVSSDTFPIMEVTCGTGANKVQHTVNIAEFIAVKGEKAKGNKLHFNDIKKVTWLASLPEPEVEAEPEEEVIREVDLSDLDDQKELF